MKYFVTGATGFVGGRVARQLTEAGHHVVALARDPTKAGALSELGISLAAGDITDKESMRAPMAGVDCIFHVAAWYKVGARDTRPAHGINVEGTRNVLELMRELAIPRGVYTSTLAVFSDTHGQVVDERYRYHGPHISEYDRTKWLAHYEVALPMIEQGLPLTIVQPGLVYGPGDTSLAHDNWVEYLRGRLLATPQRTAYCWAHVEDVAHGHILAMERGVPGETYIIAGPPHTLIEAMDTAQEITGRRAPRFHLSPAMMRVGALLLEPLSRLAALPPLYSPEGLRSAAGVTYLGSNQRARRELGYQPRSLREGLPETLAHEMQMLGQRR